MVEWCVVSGVLFTDSTCKKHPRSCLLRDVPGPLLFHMSQEHVGPVQADPLVIEEEPLV